MGVNSKIRTSGGHTTTIPLWFLPSKFESLIFDIDIVTCEVHKVIGNKVRWYHSTYFRVHSCHGAFCHGLVYLQNVLVANKVPCIVENFHKFFRSCCLVQCTSERKVLWCPTNSTRKVVHDVLCNTKNPCLSSGFLLAWILTGRVIFFCFLFQQALTAEHQSQKHEATFMQVLQLSYSPCLQQSRYRLGVRRRQTSV